MAAVYTVASGDDITKKAGVIGFGAAINQGVEGGVGTIGCPKTHATGKQGAPLRRSGAGASKDIPSPAPTGGREVAGDTGIRIPVIADIGNPPMLGGEAIPSGLEAGESFITAQSSPSIGPCALGEDHIIGRIKDKCRAANSRDVRGGGWPIHGGGGVTGGGNIADG